MQRVTEKFENGELVERVTEEWPDPPAYPKLFATGGVAKGPIQYGSLR